MLDLGNEILKEKRKIKKLELELDELNNRKAHPNHMKIQTESSINHILPGPNRAYNTQYNQFGSLREENIYLKLQLESKQNLLNSYNEITREAIFKLTELLKFQAKILNENFELKNKLNRKDSFGLKELSTNKTNKTHAKIQHAEPKNNYNFEELSNNVNELKTKLEVLERLVTENNQNKNNNFFESFSNINSNFITERSTKNNNDKNAKFANTNVKINNVTAKIKNDEKFNKNYSSTNLYTAPNNDNKYLLCLSSSLYKNKFPKDDHTHDYKTNMVRTSYTYCKDPNKECFNKVNKAY